MKNSKYCRSELIVIRFIVLLLATVCGFPVLAANDQNNQSAGDKKTPSSLELQVILKQQYKVIKSETSYPELVPRTRQAGTISPIDSDYQIVEVKDFDDGGFFQRQKILFITVNYSFLDGQNRRQGVFAFDGNKLTYLNGADSQTNISAILKEENRPLEQATPEMLAKFFTQTILHKNIDSSIMIIHSTYDIMNLDYGAIRRRLGNPVCVEVSHYYHINAAELEKCASQIKRPELFGNIKNGWKCNFVGLRESQRAIRDPSAIVMFEVSLSPTFTIQVSEKVFSNNNEIIHELMH